MRALLVLMGAAALASAQEAVSFVNEGVLNAPPSEVWKIYSTAAGFKTLGVAFADVDLRVGGLIRSRYKTDGKLGDDETIENLILAYEPQRMIALRIQKPPKSFPFKEAWKKPWTVITLTDLGNGKTHMRAASIGYGTDAESISLRRFFEKGNQDEIEMLQKHFAGRKQ